MTSDVGDVSLYCCPLSPMFPTNVVFMGQVSISKEHGELGTGAHLGAPLQCRQRIFF